MKFMNKLVPTSAILVTTLILAVGFSTGADKTKPNAIYSLCAEIANQGDRTQGGKNEITAPYQNSQFTDQLPNLQYLPIYPNAAEYKDGIIDAGVVRRFVYIARTNLAEVLAFYRTAFQNNNWVAVGASLPITPTNSNGVDAQYKWTMKGDSLPWHINLNIHIDPTIPDNMWVTLNYFVYPDVGRNLPMYSDATGETLTCREEHPLSGEKSTVTYEATVLKTYLSDRSPEDLAEFYNTTLPNYGWHYYDEQQLERGLTGLVSVPVGDIRSETGLVYSGGEFFPTDDRYFALVPHLSIVATLQSSGKTQVQLRVTIEGYVIRGIDAPIHR